MVFYFFVFFYLITDHLPWWGWPIFGWILLSELAHEARERKEEQAWRQLVAEKLCDLDARLRR